MAWYRAGTVAVTNGSAVVTGAGTSFVANVQSGHAINLPDGRAYEVLSVDSNTQLTLGSNYLGGTANGQAYSVQPNQGFAQTAATRLSDFLSQVSSWVAGALAGRFADGTLAAPGVSFSADQDTGIARVGDNAFSLITGGSYTLTANGGRIGIGTTAPTAKLEITDNVAAEGLRVVVGGGAYAGNVALFGVAGQSNGFQITKDAANNIQHIWSGTGGLERARIDSAGNLLVGTSAGSAHLFVKSVTEGNAILQIVAGASGTRIAQFNGTSQEGFSGSRAALWLGKDSTTGRSQGSAGTINASGADYAEYMVKADGCGAIAKGDVCGVDVDGKLTRSWAAAISFVVKSTDPAYVGGDSWAVHLPPRPDEPGDAPVEPKPPVLPGDTTDDDRSTAFASYQAAIQAYAIEKVAYDKAAAQYAADLPAWEAQLETARLCVDRIAFAGQVPVNIAGDFAVGDYLIAAANGGGIQAIAVAEKDITFDQYRRRLGKVWAVRDDRPWIDVQHG